MWFIFIFISGIFSSVLSQQGFYEVVAPRVVRPNSDYHVCVSTQGTSVSSTVDVILSGVSFDGPTFRTQEIVTVQPYTTRIVRLETSGLEDGNYELSVRGSGGISFHQTTPLAYVKKSYTVLIQTDKTVYKPGDKILFRAIILNSQLKPDVEVRNQPLQIHISDGEGNKVKRWKNVYATKGVFADELLLSKNLVLGNWNISVTINGQNYSKVIEVAQYILPKFLITIQAPKHTTFKENVLVANIQAIYNYGKKVKGNATITVYPTIYSGVIQPIFQNPIRKVLTDFEGSATVEFDIAKEIRLNDEYERTVVVDVTIEEYLTGRRQNNSAEVHLHKYDYNIEMVKTADYYKPGLKYTAYVKVSNNDGSLIRNNNRTVLIRYGYSRENEVYVEERHTFDQNGIIKLELYPPVKSTNATALRIEAEYMDLKEKMSPVPAALSSSKVYLQTNVDGERKAEIDKILDIVVNCTEPMRYINYYVFGRGDVLLAHSFQIDNKKVFKFHFTPIFAMVPVAHLLVNYIRADGQVIADSLDIEIDGIMQNFIDIQLNSVESYPDSQIDFTITSKPNSYVGLLAVDQNVGQLRSGYDLTENLLVEELKSYDSAYFSPYSKLMKSAQTDFFWKPGSSNTQDIFHDSGALVITNAFVSGYRPTLEDIYIRPVSYGSSTVKPDRGAGIAFHSVTRPPLAGPYAFSRIPKPVWNKPKVYLTNDIADTWLFTNFSLNIEGKTSVGRKIPSSLNTWVITGFSIDQFYGLGLLKSSPKKLKVSKPFVLSMDIPHSMQRDETLAVPIVFYNNQNNDIIADITIHNPQQKFKFADVTNEANSTKKIELYRRKKVTVKKNSGTPVSFLITPLKLGEIELKVTATSAGVIQDTVVKNLLVKAEGETLYYTKSLFIDLRRAQSYKGNLTFELPKNLIPDSESIEVSVVGDLLWPTIINLDNLIRLPTGCGEQNLVHFLPNLIVLNYLRNTRQLSPAVLKEAIANLETAYQEQLMYKRPDGSFSGFGKRDTNSSVWITSYISLALNQAKPYIYVDDQVVTSALKWLENIQAPNGSFNEIGNVIHHEMQKRDKSLALTAFVVMAFIENQKTSPIYINTINKGLDYIARNLMENDHVYTVAICSYVLFLANHPSKRSAFNLLDLKAKTANNTKWFAEPTPKKEEKNPWTHLPRSIDIEATSYALLTFLEANLLDDALPVVEWLLQQQNSLGGFTSSHDTVVGTVALYKLVSKLGANSNIEIDFKYKGGGDRFGVSRDNSMIDQRMKINNDVRQINVTAKGQGIALFRVIYQYNVNVTGPWPMFILDPQVDKNSNQHHLQLSICTSFVSQNLTSTPESNMAIMEVNLPSGFTADVDSLPSLEVSQNVQKVETKNGDTTIVLYFNNLTRYEYCPTVSAFRTHKVVKQRPASVIVYDYYDSSRRARIFYKTKRTTMCDICENEDCGNSCTRFEQQVAESKVKGGSTIVTASSVGILVVQFILLTFN